MILWLNMMIPIVFSAGPANISMAALGARFGFTGAFPFFCAINLTVLGFALAIGFGFSELTALDRNSLQGLQILGACYLLYLAYKFYRSTASTLSDDHRFKPGFVDGIMLQLFNVKMLMTHVVMYSQFLDPNLPRLNQILLLSFGFVALTSTATSLWGLGGSWLGTKIQGAKGMAVQRYLFSSMLLAVALWMLSESRGFWTNLL